MSDQRTIEEKLKSFKIYTIEEKLEELRFGVSTKLKLYEDPWKIKKVLAISDVNYLSRLMLDSNLMKLHVLPLMDNTMVAKIESGEGVRVNLWDFDCGCCYQLTLKKWRTSTNYVFNNWTTAVVKGRGLTVGNMIGLYWDPYNYMFGFRVLVLS